MLWQVLGLGSVRVWVKLIYYRKGMRGTLCNFPWVWWISVVDSIHDVQGSILGGDEQFPFSFSRKQIRL